MGQTGNIVFYTERAAPDPADLLRRAIAASGSDRAAYASRTVGPDREWACFRRNQRRLASRRTVLWLDATDIRTVARRIPALDAVQHLRRNRCLRVELVESPLATAAGLAAERDIPPHIRGDFRFGDLILGVGWHDLFESAENEDGHLFARAFFSVQLYGHSSPSNWAEYRRLVLQVPEVQAVRAAFEPITGPLDACVYWHI